MANGLNVSSLKFWQVVQGIRNELLKRPDLMKIFRAAPLEVLREAGVNPVLEDNEGETRPTMRFVAVKSPEQQSLMMLPGCG